MKSAFFIASMLVCAGAGSGRAAELTEADFRFNGPLGSQGARIAKLRKNHFKVNLTHAPRPLDWPIFFQFQIARHARGKELHVTAEFHAEMEEYAFPGNFYSGSYDRKSWRRIGMPSKVSKDGSGFLSRTA